ncbi:DUF565 domain-containing protein [Thermocoleostomius sinensis]|jgi:hypothetical protein|uniref:DUF565 domain-containing protein n=1 Tax=Thermocoleostomius sinensis A174 TaxID=2016057 RepID=A0A9E8ZBE7_9CYAN|nr:DUF565 domain-containing protein [Thermocoleostomius sinensis]WAL59722.1 DUF565 domain-containing protein [Thermocoleostomius sinensis A174]
MQNTRLSTLVDGLLGQFSRWLRNPWRRLSLMLISVLSGNFLATVLSTVAGQRAELDVVVSIFLVALTEVVSWAYYRGDASRAARRQRLIAQRENDAIAARPLILEFFNGVKLGAIYGFLVEAFKLGS